MRGLNALWIMLWTIGVVQKAFAQNNQAEDGNRESIAVQKSFAQEDQTQANNREIICISQISAFKEAANT
eukprot:gene28405-31541_t